MKKKQTFHGHGRSWSKLFLIMRLTIFLFFAFVVGVQAKSYSQTANLTLNLSTARLIDVLSEIEKQSGYYFYYNLNLDNYTVGSISVKNKDIKEVLEKTLSEFGLKYEVVDRYVIIKQAGSEATSISGSLSQQQRTISGKVTDSSGISLPGVSVVVKGTTIGIISDNNGYYSLANVPENATLQFSFVGMKTQEILVGSQTSINLAMEEETVGIEEVVAIGYGTTKKSDLTGAVTMVKSDELSYKTTANVAQALQGKVAGLQVTNSGAPGSSPKVQIRGLGSVRSDTEPLYVVDGILTNNIRDCLNFIF